MRKITAFSAFVILAAFVLAQVRGIDMLKEYAKALNGAKSLSATVSVQRIGGTASTYQVDLAKPNKARVDTPTQLIVADGTTIATFDKNDNSYYKKPQTDDDLKAVFTGDDLNIFRAFYDAAAFDKMQGAKAAGQKVRKGVAYNVVEVVTDPAGKNKTTYYIDPSDKLAKIGDYSATDKGTTDTLIVAAKDLSIDKDQPANTFAFNAPQGSKEITLEDMQAGRWYESLEEGMAMAKKLNRPMFVDFYADW